MAAAVAKPGQTLRRPRPSLNTKTTTSTRAAIADDGNETRLPPQRLAEPYVRDANYILRKFSGRPPSLIIHLHPTHFRFDQQDGSFSYDSPMKAFLVHLRRQTVPHEFLEELLDNQVPFYDGAQLDHIYTHAYSCPPTHPHTLPIPTHDTLDKRLISMSIIPYH